MGHDDSGKSIEFEVEDFTDEEIAQLWNDLQGCGALPPYYFLLGDKYFKRDYEESSK